MRTKQQNLTGSAQCTFMGPRTYYMYRELDSDEGDSDESPLAYIAALLLIPLIVLVMLAILAITCRLIKLVI